MNKSGRIKGELLRQEAEAILVAKTVTLTNHQYNVLSVTELETFLLKWHNVPKAQKEKKALLVARWAAICDLGGRTAAAHLSGLDR